jgi:membrane fusion protein, multidrug efflux system
MVYLIEVIKIDMSDTKKKSNVLPFVLGGVLLVGGYFAVTKLMYVFNNEDTENAYLETNIAAISPKIAGYVTAIKIKENQHVKKGDTLITIDNRELKLRVQQAEIALKNAEANLGIMRANAGTAGAGVGLAKSNFETTVGSTEAASAGIATAQANIEAAKARAWKAGEDFKRYSALLAEKAVTQQQFDGIKAEKEASEAQFNAAQRQLEVINKQIEVTRKQSNAGRGQETVAQNQVTAANKQIELAQVLIEQRKSEVEFSKLQLSYSVVLAPCDGVVAKKAAQVGQLLNVGTPICSIVDDQNLWITANFKENQVAKMSVGDKVKVEVDAFPKTDFEGEIESIAAATGAKFALLPPDNASGNFVKVVQRIPVKIVIKSPNSAGQLRAGMSAKAIVPIK